MRVATLGPITVEDATDLDNAPSVEEDEGDNAIRIDFQSGANRREYLETEFHGANNSEGLKKPYDEAGESPITGAID